MSSQPHYPQEPGWKKTDTSFDSAMGMRSEAKNLRDKIIKTLKDFMPMTADETADYINVDRLSVRPRFSELREMNLIYDTGGRRPNKSGKNAIVWDAMSEYKEFGSD